MDESVTDKTARFLGLRAARQTETPETAQVVKLPGKAFGDPLMAQRVKQMSKDNGWKSCTAKIDGAGVRAKVW